ncbi:hypothetical protein M8818_006785 [Zalaria obscura]|uniref:Uncharacterized protein n=1 Tax=Zalaria obscura TaxID=2024903 RepID=A0ACC3S5V0_9PEZI
MYSQARLVRCVVSSARASRQSLTGRAQYKALGVHIPSHLPRTRWFASSAQFAANSRLSTFWIPTGGITASSEAQDDTHSLLVRAGFLRQSQSGIFHMLPLGTRVQEKLERLIDKHMRSVGASKVSLSSISTEELWERSGRLQGHGPELMKLSDRKEAKLLLAPTHEEEITHLVGTNVKSYKDLPLRLYQVGRKYRDEARPRQGLLRGREFLMKDLYTFDVTDSAARETYEAVRRAYRAFLDELKVPYVVAKADTGSMGGNLSHEYHFVSPKGEDTVISCDTCDYTTNEELAFAPYNAAQTSSDNAEYSNWYGISKDRKTLVQVIYPKVYGNSRNVEINVHAVKKALTNTGVDLDSSVENPRALWLAENDGAKRSEASVLRILDPRVGHGVRPDSIPGAKIRQIAPLIDNRETLLTRIQAGEPCHQCSTGHFHLQQCIEIGHTFHLGTRYSKPMDLTVVDEKNRQIHVEMGCHGIGVTRLIAAIPSVLGDGKGLVWPASIAPFSFVVIPGKGNEADADKLCEAIAEDGVLDDREKPMGWKLNDADMIGYPVIVVLGRSWKGDRKAEVQCRRLGFKENVPEAELKGTLAKLLERL